MPQKLLKIVDELADSVSREVKSCFTSDPHSPILRADFTNKLYEMFIKEIQQIKEANMLNSTLSLA